MRWLPVIMTTVDITLVLPSQRHALLSVLGPTDGAFVRNRTKFVLAFGHAEFEPSRFIIVIILQ